MKTLTEVVETLKGSPDNADAMARIQNWMSAHLDLVTEAKNNTELNQLLMVVALMAGADMTEFIGMKIALGLGICIGVDMEKQEIPE
jgi:hypothetical protein